MALPNWGRAVLDYGLILLILAAILWVIAFRGPNDEEKDETVVPVRSGDTGGGL